MDKAEVWLGRLLYGVIALLLSHNELLYIILALDTHIFSSTDPVVHASKSSADPAVHARKRPGLGQMWVELQHFLQQNASHNQFVYCKVEQELWCEESDQHPRHLEENATGGGVTSGGYVKVHSAPYANDQGAEAECDDPKSSPLLWFSLPQIRVCARRGGIGCRIAHLFCGSVETMDLAK